MNKKLFNALWKSKIKMHEVKRDLWILMGREDKANKEFNKVKEMLFTYYVEKILPMNFKR